MPNVRVVREWKTSEGEKGESESLTDKNGDVVFPLVKTKISLIKRVTKPLLVFVPSSCGPSWEIYGMSTFRVYSSPNYTPQFDDKVWRRNMEVWERKDGLCFRDPEGVRKAFPDESFQEFYFFNIKGDFDFTLKLYKIKRSYLGG